MLDRAVSADKQGWLQVREKIEVYRELEAASTDKRRRSCVSCGLKADKAKLFRLVRDGEGSVSFDPSGKKPGRGSYVCSLPCLESAIGSRRLERTLRTAITKEDYRRIAEALEAATRGE